MTEQDNGSNQTREELSPSQIADKYWPTKSLFRWWEEESNSFEEDFIGEAEAYQELYLREPEVKTPFSPNRIAIEIDNSKSAPAFVPDFIGGELCEEE